MKKHLFLFILTLAVLSVSSVWAGEQYIFPVTSTTPCGGSSVENKLDNNTQVIYMADNNNSWADFHLNIPAAKTFLLYVGYSSNKSGDLRPFTNDIERETSGFSTSTGWYDVKEINCGASGVLQAGDNKISICNNGANFNLMYIRLEEQDAATWDVPVDMNIYWTTKDGEVIANSDFSYVKTSDGTPKADMVDNANTSGKVFMKDAITATSRKSVYFPTTGTYCFTFPIYVKDHATYSMPTITVNGNTSSATSVTTDTDNEFKDVTIELDVTAGTYPVVINYSKTDDKIGYRYVTITKKTVSCTAPNHVDISGNWDYFGGETISLTATAYDDGDAEIDEEDITGYQWKHNGSNISGATSKTLTITNCTADDGGDYTCVVSTGATCSTESSAMGTKVYALQCYTGGTTTYNFTRDGSNKIGTAEVTLTSGQKQFKIYAGGSQYYGNNTSAIYSDISNYVFKDNEDNFKLEAGLGGTFTFTIDYTDNGGAPKVSVLYPRKTIYLDPGVWNSGSAKFAYYYFISETVKGWTDFLTEDDCGMYADIPQWNGVKINAVRLNNTCTSPNWDYKWNQTSDITISSNNYVTITDWGSGDSPNSYGTYSMPTYTISYNKGSNTYTGGNSISGSKSDESKTCGIDYTLPSSAVFTATGYTQTGWATEDGGSKAYDLGNDYTTNEDQEFFPYWTVKTTSVTLNPNTGHHGTGSNVVVTATYNSALPVFSAAVPATGYQLTGYWTGETDGTKVINANGSFAANSGVWNREDGATLELYAQYEPCTYAVTLNTNDGTINAGDVTSYTYGVGATLPTNVTKSDNRFMGWYDNSSFTGSPVTTISTSTTGNKKYWARWATLYTITNGNPSNGTITVNSTAIEGETVSILATPSGGYEFSSWTITKTSDGSDITASVSLSGQTSSATFRMPAYGVTVTATFEVNPCTDSKTIQCETDRIIPTTGTSAPSKLEIITSSHHYFGYHGDGYCDFKGSEEGELYYLFRAPSSTYNFTVYLTNVDHAYMNIYTTNSAEKCDATTITYGGTTYYKKSYHALDGPTGDNPIGYRTVSSVSLNGTYIIGLYGKSWTVYDQVVIEASSDVFCQYTVSATATNGSVTGTGTYYAGETVSLTPSADPGYEFTAWSSLSGVTVSGYEDDNPLTFTMPDNAVSVTASFETSCTPHDITLTNDGNGSATASPSSACEDEAVEITATPNTGYHFDYWTTSDVSITGHESDNPLTVTMPEGDIEVTAHFLKSMIAYGESGNIGSNTGDFQYGDGSSLSASSVTDPGSKFSHNVLKYTYNINSSSGYHGITLPYDAGYTTASATGATGIGFWYRTESTTDDVLMYFKMYYSGLWNQTMVFLPATNQKWTYYYLANSNVTSATGFGFYINGSGDSKATGVIGSDGHFWLAEMEPIAVSDATVNANESKTIAHVVRDLTIYQGGEVTNSEDVIVTGSIAYHRHAKGGALNNKLDQWYTFAVPFTLSGIEVYDTDGNWYDINAVYYSDNEADQSATNPDGNGHFYLQYLEDDDKNQMTNDRWRYVNRGHSLAIDPEDWDDGTRYGYPKKDSAYIILFDDDKPAELPENYWASNPDIRFVGGPQTIASTAWTPDYDVEETEYWMYANNTLHSITLTNDAYVLNESGTMFVLEDKPTIRPFECYIQATEEFKLTYASIPMRRPGGNTPTAIEDIELNDTSRTIKVLHQGHLIIIRNGQSYNLMGARVR